MLLSFDTTELFNLKLKDSHVRKWKGVLFPHVI